MDKSPDQLCPLCGQDNHCAMAQQLPGSDSPAGDCGSEECWCVSTDIPAQALQAIPSEARGKRCICPACAGLAREVKQ